MLGLGVGRELITFLELVWRSDQIRSEELQTDLLDVVSQVGN